MPESKKNQIDQTSLYYVYNIGAKSKLIYLTVLVAVAISLALLPFVKVEISVKSPGVLQSSFERTVLLSPVNGRLVKLNMLDNQKVERNDILLVIDSSVPEKQSSLLSGRSDQLKQLLADADRLLRIKPNQQPKLQTGQYSAQWQQYGQDITTSYSAYEQANNIFNRYDLLYKNKVLTASEYEKYKFDMEQAKSAYLMVSKRYMVQWQTAENEYRNELNQLQREQVNVADEKKQYVLKAPVKGSLQSLVGLREGAYLFANQKIGEISPDANLIAFCYIKPVDIGLVKKGQPVKFQVDAFNYNQWGLLSGKVLDISDDIVLLNDNQPVFKIKCALNKNYLQLNSGYKGYLKKGMSFNARFSITERTLYQLLYDKIDDWVNPNLKNTD